MENLTIIKRKNLLWAKQSDTHLIGIYNGMELQDHLKNAEEGDTWYWLTDLFGNFITICLHKNKSVDNLTLLKKQITGC